MNMSAKVGLAITFYMVDQDKSARFDALTAHIAALWTASKRSTSHLLSLSTWPLGDEAMTHDITNLLFDLDTHGGSTVPNELSYYLYSILVFGHSLLTFCSWDCSPNQWRRIENALLGDSFC